MAALDEVRPYLGTHGGDVELLRGRRRGGRLRLEGTCNGCPSSTATLKLAIEDAIHKAAPDVGIEAEGAWRRPGLLQIEDGAGRSGDGRRGAAAELAAASRCSSRSTARRCCSSRWPGGSTRTGRTARPAASLATARCDGAVAARAAARATTCAARAVARRPGLQLAPVPLLVGDGGGDGRRGVTAASRLRRLARRASARARGVAGALRPVRGADRRRAPAPARPRRAASCMCACRAVLAAVRPPRGAAAATTGWSPTAGCGSRTSSSTTLLWEELRLPVDMAFFFRNSRGRSACVAYYPSPMGPTESLLELDAWSALEAANPVLGDAGARRRGAARQPRARRAAVLARRRSTSATRSSG